MLAAQVNVKTIGRAKVQAYADNNGVPPGQARATTRPSHRMSLDQIVAEMDNEKAAARAVELAHDAVSEAARVCKHAGLDGQAVNEQLLRASAALIHLLQVIEGK